MSDRELQSVETKQTDMPELPEWLCDWWRKNKRALREADVRALLTAYAVMDDEAQEFTLATAARRASRFPKERPALRLVRQVEALPS